MKVRDAMTKGVDFISTNSTIREAAEKMKELNVGDIPVVINDEAVGMVTDRDIAVRVVAHGLDPQAAKVVDAMTEGIFTCKEDDEVESAAKIMAKNKIRRLIVTNDNNELTGVVSLGDLATSLEREPACDALQEISK